MDGTTQALLFALLGAVLGAGVVLAWRVSDRQMHERAQVDEPAVPPGIATVLSVLRSSALVVDEKDEVLKASAPAYAFGLVRDNAVAVEELAELVRQVRRDGQIRETELVVSRGRAVAPLHVTARVAPLSSRLVLALVEDRTRERRVEAIRRDFVANVSHELKTPVGALNLLAEAVQEAADDPEAVTRFAGRMQTESHRLTRLVQQIIELSRLQGDDTLDEPQTVDVDAVVGRCIDQVAIDARSKRISVVHDGERGLQILGNGDEVALALGNLVANAVAYSPDNSRVVVAARADEMMVDLTVTDQGIGIPAGEIDRIFERFYRIDPARHRSTGGTGLGLSIVKHVAASHGGEVRVWSVEGQGSTFTLALPRRPSDVSSAPARPPPHDQPTGGNAVTRVLVVEDEESYSDALAYMLRKEGFDVSVANDGHEALAEFDRTGADIVLLDLMLPGIPGTEVCRQIRTTSNVPVIMVSAKDAEVDKVVGLELGADDYVTKPYSPRELVARIRAVLRRGHEVELAPATLEAGPVRMDVERHVVTVNGGDTKLPLKEFELLEMFLRNPGRVLTRGQLIDRVWGSDYVGDTKTLDVHVKRLRAKIEPDPATPSYLVTVRGLGYKLET